MVMPISRRPTQETPLHQGEPAHLPRSHQLGVLHRKQGVWQRCRHELRVIQRRLRVPLKGEGKNLLMSTDHLGRFGQKTWLI